MEKERDQLPLWLPIGLGAGIAAWFVLPSQAHWAAAIFTFLALALLGVALGLFRRSGKALLLFGLSGALGVALIGVRSEMVAAPRLERPVVSTFSAEVEKVEKLPARGLVRLTVAPVADAKLPPRLRINVVDTDPVAVVVAPGAQMSLKARLMPPPDAAVPGAYDYARIAWFQGVGATGRALGPITLLSAGKPRWGSDFRARLTAHIHEALPGAPGGIAAALVTGDRGAISEADAEAMRRSGLAHLLSISGLHVTAVVGATMLLVLKLLALSPRLALNAPLLLISAAAGALAGIGYTLLSGAEVPTIRSCIAALLVLGGLALGRDAITLRLIATGALFVLLFWPESLVGPSFQMSFAAVTALVALHEHPRMKALLARRDEPMPMTLARSLFGLLATGIAVEIALMPIAMFHFHKTGVYGALANILAIPLTTFVVMPLEALALVFDLVGLGAPFWWGAGQALGLLLGVAHYTAALPGAVLGIPIIPTGAFALTVAGGLWICLWRTRVRWAGIFPLALGMGWMLATPAPDLLVTGDGRHLAIRTPGQGYAILRDRAGNYVRNTLGESAGTQQELISLDQAGAARCTPDSCVMEVADGGRTWRILALRSSYLLPRQELEPACALANIVVSERRLPSWCHPAWLKIDRSLLARTGGLAITLAGRRVSTVRQPGSDHPWENAAVGAVQ
ncbi:ComEC/Rec2 family competence protein [Sphingomonas sp. C3-2]|uniref:ComEC/Rec2 family competence protein n=1 Tax=Sphingomonas sp. C3-2 TaxID=3062169 RepID=UPI00294B59FD|nr:ComEC/Rec2 family competence protein [Sphingomonas sp. C3-2]WOK36615.1 ComEC/Rec2 family competence protein [Sphingomonas sp. C3-2]